MTAKEIILNEVYQDPDLVGIEEIWASHYKKFIKEFDDRCQYFEVSDFNWALERWPEEWGFNKEGMFNLFVYGTDQAGTRNRSGKPGPFLYIEINEQPYVIGHAANPGMWRSCFLSSRGNRLSGAMIDHFEEIFKAGGPRIQKITSQSPASQEKHKEDEYEICDPHGLAGKVVGELNDHFEAHYEYYSGGRDEEPKKYIFSARVDQSRFDKKGYYKKRSKTRKMKSTIDLYVGGRPWLGDQNVQEKPFMDLVYDPVKHELIVKALLGPKIEKRLSSRGNYQVLTRYLADFGIKVMRDEGVGSRHPEL